MWFDVAFGVLCAALAGTLGWRFLRGFTGSSRWWLAYVLVVAIAAIAVGFQAEGPQSPAFVWFTAAALVLAGVDAVTLRLPNTLVYPTVTFLAAWLALSAMSIGRPEVALRVLVAGTAAGLCYLALHMMSPTGLGMGDVKFAPAIAMVLGWYSWGWVLVASVAAFALAALWGVFTIVIRRGARELPFGPFMVAGAGVTPVVGDQLLQWWL